MSTHPENSTSNTTPGGPLSTQDTVLETGASTLQTFGPLKSVCAHLNAFHTYASAPGERYVEANHYCAHLTASVRQCLLYDSPHPDARLIGIEYMITPSLYTTLSPSERKYWHSHVFEVKSGMLIMPGPESGSLTQKIPGAQAAWEAAETKEMEDVVELYGKVFHLWQTDRGDQLPLGEPQLMTSFTDASQLPQGDLEDRDRRFNVDTKHKAELRKYIKEPAIHEDADSAWKRRNSM